MTITTHHVKGAKVAEITADTVIINTAEEAVAIIGTLAYQDYDTVILHRKHLTPSFFDLKNTLAGDILQKFSTYRLRLIITGTLTDLTGKSVHDFIYESNKGTTVNFMASSTEALKALTR